MALGATQGIDNIAQGERHVPESPACLGRDNRVAGESCDTCRRPRTIVDVVATAHDHAHLAPWLRLTGLDPGRTAPPHHSHISGAERCFFDGQGLPQDSDMYTLPSFLLQRPSVQRRSALKCQRKDTMIVHCSRAFRTSQLRAACRRCPQTIFDSADHVKVWNCHRT